MWNGPTCPKTVNFVIAEAELLQHFLVMLADLWGTPRRHFGNAVNFQRIADGELHVLAGAFEWNNDVIRQQLLVVDTFRWVMHNSVGDVGLVQGFAPVRQRL